MGVHSLGNGIASFNSLYGSYKRGARLRGLMFDITKDEFRELTSADCHYCGLPPSNHYQCPTCVGDYTYNGVDRVDNSKGYIHGNVVPCCTYCNRSKNNQSEEQFLEWVQRVYHHIIEGHRK